MFRFFFSIALAGAALAAQPATAQAQSSQDAVKLAQYNETRCRKEVRDYLEAIRYVRTSAGPQIGDKVASGYVSEQQLESVAASQGPCAAAQLLRQRGATR